MMVSMVVLAVDPALEKIRRVRWWRVFADARLPGRLSDGRVVAFCAVWTAGVEVEKGRCLLESAMVFAFLSWD